VKIPGKTLLSFGLLFAAFVPTTASSELPTRFAGVVLDQGGGVILDASVTLFSLQRVLETKTDDMGRFAFGDLLSGMYDLQIAHPGFKTRTVEIIQVMDRVVQDVSITLQVQSLTCDIKPTVSYERRSANVNLKGSVNRLFDGPLKKARLTLTSLESGQIHVARSNDKGEFQLSELEPGRYTLRATHDGYWDGEIIDLRVARENLTNLSPVYISRKDDHRKFICQ
jgi:Carboxypeptidase regulatory-like domain